MTCNSGQYFAGNRELFSVGCLSFLWRETVSLLDVMNE